MATVDFIDNFQVPWEQMCEQVHGPTFQGLGEDSVVGVGAGADTDVPGLDNRQEDIITRSSGLTTEKH